MDPVLKFAAQERGSARTLVLVPGGPRAVPNGAATAGARASVDGAAPNGAMRRVDAESPRVGNGEARGRDLPGARTVACRAGQKLFGPGGGGEAVYLVRGGSVALFKALPGNRSICVGLLGPDDVFMQETGRDGAPVSGVTAEVLADATIAVLELAALPRLMAASPDLATAVVAGFAQRLTGVQGLVEQLLSRDITLRLATMLLALADRFGEPGEDGFVAIDIPVPHKLLARLIGANRVTVTRVVAEFRAAGLAESRGRNQISVDTAKLRAYFRDASRRSSVVGR
ncbi:MAG: family transcriptional regulator, cyclic receptor protein [Thermomicrobiales bacterium]|nr:family transcriptional regulator, cyclic receptor protein [Thermomicrobiales bacterium]